MEITYKSGINNGIGKKVVDFYDERGMHIELGKIGNGENL